MRGLCLSFIKAVGRQREQSPTGLAKIADGGEAYLMGARDIESKYRAGYSIDAGRRSLSSSPTFRPLYDWTAAEVWLYLFSENAKINRVSLRRLNFDLNSLL